MVTRSGNATRQSYGAVKFAPAVGSRPAAPVPTARAALTPRPARTPVQPTQATMSRPAAPDPNAQRAFQEGFYGANQNSVNRLQQQNALRRQAALAVPVQGNYGPGLNEAERPITAPTGQFTNTSPRIDQERAIYQQQQQRGLEMAIDGPVGNTHPDISAMAARLRSQGMSTQQIAASPQMQQVLQGLQQAPPGPAQGTLAQAQEQQARALAIQQAQAQQAAFQQGFANVRPGLVGAAPAGSVSGRTPATQRTPPHLALKA